MAETQRAAEKTRGPDQKELAAQLRQECEELDRFVAGLEDSRWQAATVFYNWTVRDEIMHLLFLDWMGVVALTDAAGFAEKVKAIRAGQSKNIEISQQVREKYKSLSNKEVLELWRSGYRDMCDRFGAQDEKTRMPWFGPDMSVPSFTSARQMETWAHGQDIYDLLRTRRTNTDRIKNVAELGVRTFKWSFVNRKEEVPAVTPYVELTSPSGAIWQWNDPNAEASVKGSAEDFALVVTKRRHVLDTALSVKGEGAKRWMIIAQCFAGPPEDGPAPGARVVKYS